MVDAYEGSIGQTILLVNYVNFLLFSPSKKWFGLMINETKKITNDSEY